MATISDKDTSLWWLAAPPSIWAVHFLLSYGTAAVWCAKMAQPTDPVTGAQISIAAYTGVALTATLAVGIRGWRHHRHGGEPPPHDYDSREDRHRFLGFATVLLAGLGAIAIAYEAIAVLLVESCL